MGRCLVIKSKAFAVSELDGDGVSIIFEDREPFEEKFSFSVGDFLGHSGQQTWRGVSTPESPIKSGVFPAALVSVRVNIE